MNASWADATALVTGGGSGIGRALCLALARRGTRVIVTDLNGASAKETASACGERATSQVLDVTDATAVRTAIEATAAAHGRLDYVFNNAGIGVGGEANEIPLGTWQRCIDVNIKGVVHGVIAAYPLMVKQRNGHIINTASLAGLGAAPLLAPYSMAKHAVVGLSLSLRLEAKKFGVRVSALCPGVIETPILDTVAPELAALPGTPDFRRYLIDAAGSPYPAASLAEDTLRGIEGNLPVIVAPARALWMWRIARWFPALAEIGFMRALAKERAKRDGQRLDRDYRHAR